MIDLIGHSIGRYHILEQLGQGGMAVVYKAFDTQNEREVAVKIIRRDAVPAQFHERVMKRFAREAKVLASLSHPNILRVLDYGEHDGMPYLAMELIAGGTLKQRLGQPFAWPEFVRLLLPVARALQYAHTQGVVHRDIKPANILITAEGALFVSDFGIAKILVDEEEESLTGTGLGVGTPEYMAPEQGLGKEVDGRADIYSLGIVLFELITGQKPFRADTPMAVLLKQINDPLPRPTQLVQNLPIEIERVLIKALAKQAANRFADMGIFANALEGLLIAGDSLTFDSLPKDPKKVKLKIPRMIFLIVAILVVIAVFFGGVSHLIPTTDSSSNLTPTALAIEVSPTTRNESASSILEKPPATDIPVPTRTPFVAVTLEPTATPPMRDWHQGRLALLMRYRNGIAVYILDLTQSGSKPVLVYTPDSPALLSGAAFSPKGDRISYYDVNQGTNWLIKPVPGTSPDKLGDCKFPSFSSSGKHLLCMAGGQIILYDVYSQSVLTTYPLQDGILPVLSPDEMEVAYVVIDGKTTQIFKQALDAQVPIPLAEDSNENYAPAWSLDGTWIAYQSNAGTPESEIWVMTRDGKQKKRLTQSPNGSWSRAPTWSADGHWVYFVSNQAGSLTTDYGEVFAVSVETGETIQITHTNGLVYDWRISWGPE